MVLITGGARAGKSRAAHDICAAAGSRVLYIATAVTKDELMIERIRRSRQQRPYDWDVYEGCTDLAKKIEEAGGKYDAVLIENLSTLVVELMNNAGFIAPGSSFRECEKKIMEEIGLITFAAKRVSAEVVLVTNETISCQACMGSPAQAALEILGRVNQYVAATCGEVYFVVSGIPIKIK